MERRWHRGHTQAGDTAKRHQDSGAGGPPRERAQPPALSGQDWKGGASERGGGSVSLAPSAGSGRSGRGHVLIPREVVWTEVILVDRESWGCRPGLFGAGYREKGRLGCADSECKKFMIIFVKKITFPTNPSPWDVDM